MSDVPRLVALMVLCMAPAVWADAAPAVDDQARATHRQSDAAPATPRMTLRQAAVLGVVEGVTEYLPISSTGHLIVTQRIMGIEASDEANAYAIVIQGGAIVAVLGLYWRRCRQMVRGLAGRDREGLGLLVSLVVALVPAVVIALPTEGWIKHHLFGGDRWGLWPTVGAWFVGGVLILVVAWWRAAKGATPRTGRELMHLTWKMALLIGLAQCIAMWPGVSRSLATIVGGVLVGLSLPAAVEFSFLLRVVTLGGATVKDAVEFGPAMLDAYGPAPLAVGFCFAFIAAVLAIRWMVAYLNRHGMQIFGYYRVAIAIIVAAALLAGWL